MTTKTLDQQTARFIASIATCLPSLSGDIMQDWIDSPQALKNFLGGLNSPLVTNGLFSVIATTSLGAVAGKLTANCFASPQYVYRDADFDNWLSANQPDASACVISTLAFSKSWTFVEAAAKVLGIRDSTDVVLLGNALIAGGHTMTLPQGEEMVEATERGENTGMRIDGYGNFFLVETGDPKNPVSVGYVDRVGHAWNAYVFTLGYGCRRDAGHRLLVRNLSDASKL